MKSFACQRRNDRQRNERRVCCWPTRNASDLSLPVSLSLAQNRSSRTPSVGSSPQKACDESKVCAQKTAHGVPWSCIIGQTFQSDLIYNWGSLFAKPVGTINQSHTKKGHSWGGEISSSMNSPEPRLSDEEAEKGRRRRTSP